MNNNYYNKYERRIRHIMCIFLSLETLLFCLLVITFYFDYVYYDMGLESGSNTMKLLHYHVIDLSMIISKEFWILCIGAIVCTVLSIRFKWFYIIYEWLHCMLGVIYFFRAAAAFPAKIILFLILSVRFCIYIYLIKNKL